MKALPTFFWLPLTSIMMIATLISACTPLQQKRRDPECRLVFEQIERCWGRDPATGLHLLKCAATGDHGFGHFKNDACFQGLRQQDIERLFGKADTIAGGHMYYYMSQPCLQGTAVVSNGCYYLQCILDANGFATRIMIATMFENID